ncbi:hypothetical protein GCM10018954_048230 [Kutzneria kofuensis]
MLTLPCDVGDWSQISGVVAKTEETFGRLDAVFANAGSSVGTSFLGRSGEDPELWREMVVTNVCGPAYTARAALPALMRSRGHLVLTGSASGRACGPAVSTRRRSGPSPAWRRPSAPNASAPVSA